MNFSKKAFTLIPEFIQNTYVSFKKKYQISEWNKRGQNIPVPHAIKQELIIRYKNKHKINTLVESGTYFGDMVWAQRNNFDKIYSIELNKDLSEFSQKRFKRNKHIEIIFGDSGKIMPILIEELSQKTLFWLDGHFSAGITSRGDKDCPIAEEMKAILSSNIEHVVLISNARCYTGQRDYPSLEGLSQFILQSSPESKIHVENDCIIIELKTSKEDK